MKAMILAAGLGTRLKPITDKIPKALVEIEGVPMLERLIGTLKLKGFDRIVVNVHHFAGQIKEFIENKDFGVNISISDETENILDTGGGIVHALPILFREDDEPVLIHNVDILSNANLEILLNELKGEGGSKLLVSDRKSTRKLIFDQDKNLIGWHDLKNEIYRPEHFKTQTEYQELAFSGIYAISKASVEEMKNIMGEGKYSVMDYFLNENRKQMISGIEQNNLKLLDIGKPATLLQAPELLIEFNNDSN